MRQLRWRRLAGYIFAQRNHLLLIAVFSFSLSAVGVLQPWPLKILLDYAFQAETFDAVRLVLLASAFSFLLFVLSSFLDIGLTWSWTVAGQRMVCDLTANLFAKLQRLSFKFHQKHSVGDSLTRVTGDAWCIYTLAESVLVNPWQQLFSLVTIAVISWKLEPALAQLMFAMAPVLGILTVFLGRKLKRSMRQTRQSDSRLTSFVHQTLTVLPLVQAFGTEDRNAQQFRDLASSSVENSQKVNLLKSSHGLVLGFARVCGVALILYVCGSKVLAGSMTAGTLLVFVSYFQLLHDGFQKLFDTYLNLKTIEVNIERVFEILDEPEEVVEKPDAKSFRLSKTGSIVFENVTFGYEPGVPVLKRISFEAKAGEKIALVGPTGSGKSTLVSMIPRFFDPWQGQVRMDGMDIRDLKLSDLRSQIALVLQEPFLLPVSVAENIAYGRKGASREEIQKAAEAACADEFIQKLAEGYDTVIGERGSTLSGGEKQRIAIARAFLKDAPTLILDEPTSALDLGTESRLLEALERLLEGRTAFVIAHRLSTVRRADRIYVLENGTIREGGTHEQLISRAGLYEKLHQIAQIKSAAFEGSA